MSIWPRTKAIYFGGKPCFATKTSFSNYICKICWGIWKINEKIGSYLFGVIQLHSAPSPLAFPLSSSRASQPPGPLLSPCSRQVTPSPISDLSLNTSLFFGLISLYGGPKFQYVKISTSNSYKTSFCLPAFFFFNTFKWNIVELPCCVNYCCRGKWLNYTYIFIPTSICMY